MNALASSNERLLRLIQDAARAALCFSHYNWRDERNECWPDCAELARERGDWLGAALLLVHKGDQRDLHSILCDLQQQAEASGGVPRPCPAQAIVEKLPKTADGVPITPGMVLYQLWTTDYGKTWTVRKHDVWAVSVLGIKLRDDPTESTLANPNAHCYSTDEAAQAARDKP